MSTSRQTFPPVRRPLMNFHTLAPTVSKQPLTAEAVPKADEASVAALAETKRRTS